MKRPGARAAGQRLYDLLPRYVRYRDQTSTRSLEALFAVFQGPFDQLHTNMGQLYDAWFIETCDWWLVPYLGELVGVRGLRESERNIPTMRALVANTLAYRRSKGTRGALERSLSNAVGCAVEVVDEGSQLSLYQNLRTAGLEPGETFDVWVSPVPGTRGVDLRRDTGASGAGISRSEVEIKLWEAMALPVGDAEPRPVGTREGGEARYTLNPFGTSMPLYHLPTIPWQPVFESTPATLPRPVGRSEARQRLESANREAEQEHENSLEGLLSLGIEVDGVPLKPGCLKIAALGTWEFPETLASGVRGVLDPRLGRLVLRSAPKSKIRVSYTYGGFGDIGGGPYETPTLPASQRRSMKWSAVVSKSCRVRKLGALAEGDGQPHGVFWSFWLAIEAWNRYAEGRQKPSGCLRILDSTTYQPPRLVIHLPPGSHLRIEAGAYDCPFLQGTVLLRSSCGNEASCDAGADAGNEIPRVEFIGLWWEGQIRIQGRLDLEMRHCTLRPPLGRPSEPVITSSTESTSSCPSPRFSEITVQSCVLGGLRLPNRCRLVVADSVIDGEGGAAIAPSEPVNGTHSELESLAELDSVTLLGSFEGLHLQAVSSLIDGSLRCVPGEEPTVAYCSLGEVSNGVMHPRHCLIAPHVEFVSRTFGDPGYARLDPTPLLRGDDGPSVLTAAEDGCELGAFRRSAKVWRVANFETVLEEYLPLGLRTTITSTLGFTNTARYLALNQREDDDVR